MPIKAPTANSSVSSATKKTVDKPPGSKTKRSGQKVGVEDSETRGRLLDAAEQLMREEGYAAVTSRRLGARAGVNPQLVHYYFKTMDNLFLELWKRYSEHYIVRLSQAFLSPNPLRRLWDCHIDRHDAALGSELTAAARHRKALRAEIARTIERLRAIQAGALSQVMDDHGLRGQFGSPKILAIFMVGLARILVLEDELGISGGKEARELIEDWIDRLETGDAAPEPAP
jgi:AcrR family transcriptional regulator